MEKVTLYRKRLIPNECILLKDDVILHYDEHILVTKWQTLKPRNDFHHGYSCYFFDLGIKVSKFLHEDEGFVYWYCDIVNFSKDDNAKSIIITDLLADVVIMPDGTVNVLDIDELCEAKELNLITESQFFTSVKTLGNLIKKIQDNEFHEYSDILDSFIK